VRRYRLLICLFLLSVCTVYASVDRTALVQKMVTALEKAPGFSATYKAASASGNEVTIRVLYARPNKMRMDLEPLGAVTLFDGKRYLYYDKERAKAVVLDAAEALKHLSILHQTMNGISWVEAETVAPADTSRIYPSLNLDLNFEQLDLSLEISTKPHRHSWLRETANRHDAQVVGEHVILARGQVETLIKKRISLETGLLQSIELGPPDDVLGSLRLVDFQIRQVQDNEFAFAIPEGTQVRNQKEDPSLLQQLLMTSFRGSLDRTLNLAKAKWTTLTASQKQEMRKAIQKVFFDIFRLAEQSTLAHLSRTMDNPMFIEQVKQALNNQEARRRFIDDHPNLEQAEIEKAWRKQVLEETRQAIFFDISRSLDQEVVEPLRTQVLEETAGMNERARKELVLSATEPIHLAFREMVAPTITKKLDAILN